MSSHSSFTAPWMQDHEERILGRMRGNIYMKNFINCKMSYTKAEVSTYMST